LQDRRSVHVIPAAHAGIHAEQVSRRLGFRPAPFHIQRLLNLSMGFRLRGSDGRFVLSIREIYEAN
jgi:hypothetical protein